MNPADMWRDNRATFGQEAMPQDGHSSPGDSGREGSSTAVYNPYFTGRPRAPIGPVKTETMDRREIIRQIKERAVLRQKSLDVQEVADCSPMDIERAAALRITPTLLPSPDIESVDKVKDDTGAAERMASGLAISRPRSALHKGDFNDEVEASSPWTERPRDRTAAGLPVNASEFVATSPPAPWHDGFPNSIVHRTRQLGTPRPAVTSLDIVRPRASSQASLLSKSFTHQAPTSPLVNQSNAEDGSDGEDFALPKPEFLDDRFGRRRTYSPRSLSGFSSLLEHGSDNSWSNSPPSMKRESTYPLKAAHQPRRSISNVGSLPGTPLTGPRRLSLIGSSPLQSSMVGSFEESILRGRMSSTPSRPLDFTAHIGVLGAGDCRPSLKCPPHVTISFPAVFYSYGPGSTSSDSQPSPYVGLVDLENSASERVETATISKPRPSRASDTRGSLSTPGGQSALAPEELDRRRRKQRERRRSRSPIPEPRGGYRIPPKGQLQIIIKNPNKTAVKLFLIPYDVSDMQPGQKTFIRQRSYSAGPIIDMPLAARTNLGTDRPEASLSMSDDPRERPVLRYLIHLHICCTAKGRLYLYKSMRVVFANRVPDGKEKLRNEVQLPEPKYSTYKPNKETTLAASATDRRQTDGAYGDMRDSAHAQEIGNPSSTTLPQRVASSLPATTLYDKVLPHRRTEHSYVFPMLETVSSRPASRGWSDEQEASLSRTISREQAAESIARVKSPKSPLSPLLSPRSRAISPFTDPAEGTGSMTFSRSDSSEMLFGVRAQSLLAKRLKDLDGIKRQSASSPTND